MEKAKFIELSAQITKKQNELAALGEESPRKMAYAFIGMMQIPPVSGEVLASEYSYAMKEHGVKNDTSADQEENGDTITFLYKAWFDDNDEIASDKQLAHFTGYSSQAFRFARYEAQKKGYKFESIAYGAGWRVVSKPEIIAEKTFTLTETELMDKFKQFLKLQK